MSYCYETGLEIWAGFGSAWQFRVNEFSEFFITILSIILFRLKNRQQFGF